MENITPIAEASTTTKFFLETCSEDKEKRFCGPK